MLKHWKMISIYSGTHFLVDFACAFLMFSAIRQSPEWFTCILIYNFCAFAMQMPIGIVADKISRNNFVAGLGTAMVAAGYGIVLLPSAAGSGLAGAPLAGALTAAPLAAAAVIGLGNAMFHVGGGVDFLNVSENKSAALGIFVSPGAFGVFFGTMLGRAGSAIVVPILVALLAAALLIFPMSRIRGGNVPPNAPFSPEVPPKLFAAVIGLFAVVCLRSYVGLSIDFPWKGVGYWGLALVCASAFGKTIGGFLFDKFGGIKTATITLGAASLLFLLPHVPIAGVSSILLFNMTMPITLWLVAKCIPGAKGFSFGLLTFALFLGFLPVYLGTAAPPFWLYAILSAISLALLMFALNRFNNPSQKEPELI